MKNIFLTITFFTILNSRAQTIFPLYKSDKEVHGAYYKDVDNDLSNFVGTWKYTNGTTSLTITLERKEMKNRTESLQSLSYYEDVLIGGYRYIENGVEMINTLPLLSQNFANRYDYTIFGNTILSAATTNCTGCSTILRAVQLQFIDPDREILGMDSKMYLARADSGGVQKLLLKFILISGGLEEAGTTRPYDEYTVPFGDYLLVKQ